MPALRGSGSRPTDAQTRLKARGGLAPAPRAPQMGGRVSAATRRPLAGARGGPRRAPRHSVSAASAVPRGLGGSPSSTDGRRRAVPLALVGCVRGSAHCWSHALAARPIWHRGVIGQFCLRSLQGTSAHLALRPGSEPGSRKALRSGSEPGSRRVFGVDMHDVRPSFRGRWVRTTRKACADSRARMEKSRRGLVPAPGSRECRRGEPATDVICRSAAPRPASLVLAASRALGWGRAAGRPPPSLSPARGQAAAQGAAGAFLSLEEEEEEECYRFRNLPHARRRK
jgi:hypothetical protein